MDLRSVSVGVEDMERALQFYRQVFGAEPVQAEDRFSIFSFDGLRFGRYNASMDGEELEFGNNCVPDFEVDDIEAAYERIGRIAPEIDDDIMAVGEYRLFQFEDTEGNTIEIFSEEA